MKVKLYLKKCHEALWNWLAKNPDKDKGDWPGWKTISFLYRKGLLIEPIPIGLKCFACVYGSCSKCPVVFSPSGKRDCEPLYSFFYSWIKSRSKHEYKEASKYAKLIADGWVGEDR
jgi:hypothetical protein